MYTAHGSLAVLSTLLLLQLIQQVLAQGQACTSSVICAPAPGEVWSQDSIESVIWNPLKTAPFDQYDKVDIYVVDDNNSSQALLLQGDVDLSTGMTATRLQTQLFPDFLPVNRSCHLLMTRVGDALDGYHQTLNSSSFFMLRTKQDINGTIVTIFPTSTAATTATLTATLSSTTTQTFSRTPTATVSPDTPILEAPPTTTASPSEQSGALSPLVIGLISGACAILLVAIIAIVLLLRARRRFKGDAGHFKSLYDQPSSPTDEASKISIFKDEGGQGLGSKGSIIIPTVGAALAAGRLSSNTTRSAEPMIKGAPGALGYGQHGGSSPTTQLPLVERKPSTLRVSETAAEASMSDKLGASNSEDGSEAAVAPSRTAKGSVLTAGDAQLIAETFRKSMRRPQWETEDPDDDDDEEEGEEQDEVRRAANELLRKELSEQGLDVQRGVQRRVTIQTRPQRASLPPPMSQSVSIPEP